ncbi:MAG TPA: metallopeptidase TldD-related protein [Candidatus Angelobacter sp.]|jgi:hypothetical protein|nr:metallopeptidase TldD-related protein [Candidatus Angelobacter sp.]
MKWMFLCTLLLAASALQAQDDVVFRAMQDELQRSTRKLKLEQLDRPYFISYKIIDTDSKSAAASFGSLISSSESRSRFLTVQVRVGDYALDSSNFLSLPSTAGVASRMFGGVMQLPLDDNYDELRRQIWLATDSAYKKALEDLSGKRAALQNKNRTDNIPDFSKEKPLTVSDLLPRAEVDLREAERLMQRLSSLFREMPSVQTSRVSFSAVNTLERFINSEGTSYTRRSPLISLQASAATQAADGMPLNDFVSTYGHSMKELLPEAAVASGIRELGERLSKLQSAPLEERYNGPVLFQDQAAAEIVAQVLAQKLPASPSMISDNPQMARAMAARENSFLDKIEARVLPEFLSLVDDPTATQADDHTLLASYKVDEEGTAARKTLVVENGVLKTLLTSRGPVRGILQSTGNLRTRGVAPSNLFLVPQKASSPEEIKAQFIDLIKRRGKPYGVLVRRLENPTFAPADQMQFLSRLGQEEKIAPALLAYRLYADGHEELVRNINLSVSTQSFKDILAVSNTRIVYTAPFSAQGGSPFSFTPGSGSLLVSYVVPSALLFEDVSAQKPTGEVAKPPASGHPFFAK